MGQCKKCWDTVFPDTGPFVATHISAYVTENCDDFSI